jgi:hypothetical protein
MTIIRKPKRISWNVFTHSTKNWKNSMKKFYLADLTSGPPDINRNIFVGRFESRWTQNFFLISRKVKFLVFSFYHNCLHIYGLNYIFDEFPEKLNEFRFFFSLILYSKCLYNRFPVTGEPVFDKKASFFSCQLIEEIVSWYHLWFSRNRYENPFKKLPESIICYKGKDASKNLIFSDSKWSPSYRGSGESPLESPLETNVILKVEIIKWLYTGGCGV